MEWDRRDADDSREGRDASASPDLTDRSKREALDAVLHGAETDPARIEDRTSIAAPQAVTTDQLAGPNDDRQAPPGAAAGDWEAVVRAEEARWFRYGHPCVAVELEVVGGEEVTTHLGHEAGRRVRERLDQVIATTTRMADRFEPRGAWRMVALLPETDASGAGVAMIRLQRAFSDSMGSALAVRLDFGLASPAPTGTVAVAFHQAGQQLAARRRRDQPDRPRSVTAPNQVETRSSAAADADAADSRRSAAAPQADGLEIHDLGVRIDALARMLARGLITQDEHDAKRTEILDRL